MATAEKLENLLNLSEAAKAANMNPITLRALCQRGGLGDCARKIGDSWVITPQGVYFLKASKDLTIISQPDKDPVSEMGIWKSLREAQSRAKHLLDLPDVKENGILYAQLKAIHEALEEATN